MNFLAIRNFTAEDHDSWGTKKEDMEEKEEVEEGVKMGLEPSSESKEKESDEFFHVTADSIQS